MTPYTHKLSETDTIRIHFPDGETIYSDAEWVWDDLEYAQVEDPAAYAEIWVGTNPDDAQWESFESLNIKRGTYR